MPYSVGYAIADIASLKALSSADLVNGYARWVTSKTNWYGWDAASTATADDDTVVALNSAPSSGRFVRSVIPATITGIKTFQSTAYPGFIVRSSDAVATRILIDSNTNTNVGFDLSHAGQTKWSVASYKKNAGDAAYSFSFFNNNVGITTDAFFIRGDNSNIGFGTSTPGCKVQVVGGVVATNSAAAAIDPGAGNFNATGQYRVNNLGVVGSQKTGWGTPTGAISRTSFDTATATTADLAQRLAALITDLRSHGLIGN